jgi:hypothetical protein
LVDHVICEGINRESQVLQNLLTPFAAEASVANVVAKAPAPFFGLSKKDMSCAKTISAIMFLIRCRINRTSLILSSEAKLVHFMTCIYQFVDYFEERKEYGVDIIGCWQN